MVGASHSVMASNVQDQKKLHAEIVRSEIMFGNIRIRCPNDNTEHEVPAGTKEFLCPVDGAVLVI